MKIIFPYAIRGYKVKLYYVYRYLLAFVHLRRSRPCASHSQVLALLSCHFVGVDLDFSQEQMDFITSEAPPAFVRNCYALYCECPNAVPYPKDFPTTVAEAQDRYYSTLPETVPTSPLAFVPLGDPDSVSEEELKALRFALLEFTKFNKLRNSFTHKSNRVFYSDPDLG